MTDDLVPWLRGVLDSKEQEALAEAHYDPDGEGGYYSCPATRHEPLGDLPWGEAECDCGLSARRGARLACVQAHRAIVDRCAEVFAEFDRRDTWGSWPEFGPKRLAEDVLTDLASAYADQPGYQEWEP